MSMAYPKHSEPLVCLQIISNSSYGMGRSVQFLYIHFLNLIGRVRSWWESEIYCEQKAGKLHLPSTNGQVTFLPGMVKATEGEG